MTLLLAPMEGLLDHTLREVLTSVGGIDRCVSEFIRVTGQLLPERVFLRIVPELGQGGCTRSGVPVRPQLLGSDAACLADNAARLATLGAPGVDFNFGCPAKVVNRHGGGALLLDEPERLHQILSAARRAVPAEVPLSAKMRLGVRDDALALDCARALEAGGASEIVVHARTRDQGYRPPARWERVAAIRAAVRVPVIANGEVWSVADALRCRAQSGGTALMVGRGLVADPGLGLALRAVDQGEAATASETPPRLPWAELVPLLQHYLHRVALRVARRHQCGRVKQWLHYLRRRYPEAETAYQQLRTLNDPALLAAALERLGQAAPRSTPTAFEAQWALT